MNSHLDSVSLSPNLVRQALDYIEAEWRQLERFHPHDEGTLIGLPHPYFVPSRQTDAGFTFDEMYYWDSYFTAQAFYGTKRDRLAWGLLENLLHQVKRFGVVANANRFYLMGRSQPPLLTSFVWEIYRDNPSKRWLERSLNLAKEEYRRVWMGTKQPHWRQVHSGLSRYYDVNVLDELAETESGWDMNPRFDDHCLDFLPVDLNAMLYKYESDFASGAAELAEAEEAAQWQARARVRRQKMDELMWDEAAGFYFDYNYQTLKRGKVWSLAGYFPLWAGMVPTSRAKRMVDNLGRFEFGGGLATTTKIDLDPTHPKQWAYPNGWAPLQLIIIRGLERYGYHAEAARIARKWLAANLQMFRSSGQFLEKYNVVHPGSQPSPGHYPSQTGFGWSNAVFVRLSQDYLLPSQRPQAAASRRVRGLNSWRWHHAA